MSITNNLKSLIKSAKEVQFQLFDTGAFKLDLSEDNNGSLLCSSIKGAIDAGAILSIASRDGYTFHDLSQGVNLTNSPILNEYKELIASNATLKPVEYKPIKRQLETWVISGKELDKELAQWGLNNPGKVFQSMKVLGIDLAGKDSLPVQRNSSLGFKKPIASTGNRRSVKSNYANGSELDIAIQQVLDNNIPHNFESVYEFLLDSALYADEDDAFDTAFLVCDQLGVPIGSSVKRPIKSGISPSLKRWVLQWLIDHYREGDFEEDYSANDEVNDAIKCAMECRDRDEFIQRNSIGFWAEDAGDLYDLIKENLYSSVQRGSRSRIPIQQDRQGLIRMVGDWVQRVHEGLMDTNVFYKNLVRLLQGNGYPGSRIKTIYEQLLAGSHPEVVLAGLRRVQSSYDDDDDDDDEGQEASFIYNISDELRDRYDQLKDRDWDDVHQILLREGFRGSDIQELARALGVEAYGWDVYSSFNFEEEQKKAQQAAEDKKRSNYEKFGNFEGRPPNSAGDQDRWEREHKIYDSISRSKPTGFQKPTAQ